MTADSDIVAGLGAFLASVVCVFLVEMLARQRGLLDNPNWRSSHSVPTPRLGGVGIIVGTWVAFLLTGDVVPEHIALIAAATALGAVGLVDDIRPLPPLLRLVGQVVVSVALVAAIDPTIVIALPGLDIELPWAAGVVVTVVWLVGMVNVWNFMDGLDGLAAGTAAIAAVGLIALGVPAAVMLAVTGATIGFLVWNHHPASIFMGDSGSMFLGVLIGGAALTGHAPVSLGVVAILLAPFLLDATYTLLMRLWHHRPLLSAHHEHLYQRLAATGLPQREIAAGYWLASGACVLLASAYDRVGVRGQLMVLAALGVGFAGYVTMVRGRERRSAEL